ncbi:MAG: hypothetical protein AVDCRST_MAG01-01-1600, partial [uncultured Rubrobacteraceae bacterium]
ARPRRHGRPARRCRHRRRGRSGGLPQRALRSAGRPGRQPRPALGAFVHAAI